MQLILRSLAVGEALTQLREGRIDVAVLLTEPPPAASGITVETLVRENFLLLAAPEHPLAALARVQAEDLRETSLLLTEAGCTYRAAFESRLLVRGVRLTTTMEFGSIEAIKQCVMANLGVTLLPEIAVCHEVNTGRLIALPWFASDFHMHTRLLWHKDKWLSPALGEFIHLSEQMLLANPS